MNTIGLVFVAIVLFFYLRFDYRLTKKTEHLEHKPYTFFRWLSEFPKFDEDENNED